ncbi:MAG: hypothetical protein JWN41_979, partial [Thermoleophilia bacterium]|nr:hypothetical protein [Thermoleophilia bacterium]
APAYSNYTPAYANYAPAYSNYSPAYANYASGYSNGAPTYYAAQRPTLGLGAMAGLAGAGLLGLGGGLSPVLRWAAPIGGAYLGWTRGADLLRSTGAGQAVVGWLSQSPVGSVLGRDPYKPVGGALGALAGLALGSLFR